MGSNDSGNKIFKKVLKEMTDLAVSASTGTIHAYAVRKAFSLLAKVFIVIIIFIIMMCIVVSALFSIIFSDLGFGSASEFAGQMFTVETEDINAGLPTFYGTSVDSTLDNAFQAKISEIKELIDFDYNEYVRENVTEVSVDEYGNTEETVYDGYDISNSDYTSFWSSRKYIGYFSPIIQNNATTLLKQYVKNEKISYKNELSSFLVSQIENGEWFSYSELEETSYVETWTEEITPARDYYYYIGPTGKTFQYLDKNGKYYIDEMDLIGHASGAQWLTYFQDHTEWWGKATEPAVTVEHSITHITKHYSMSMNPETVAVNKYTNAEYRNIEDNESMSLAIKLVEDIDSGKYGNLIFTGIRGIGNRIRSIFQNNLHIFDKSEDYSYEDFLVKLNVTASFGTATGTEDGIYVWLRDAGFTIEQACGIIANIYFESSYNPEAFNSAGGGIGAYGLCQWRSGRQQALKNYSNYNTVTVQLQFIVDELNGSEKAAMAALQNAESAQDAAKIFNLKYERSGTDGVNRAAKALELYNKYYPYGDDYAGALRYSSIVDSAKALADDDSHGYSQNNRTCNPDMDCSSFVYYTLLNCGFSQDTLGSYPFSTSTMGNFLVASGFREISFTSQSELEAGDILVNVGSHTEIYMGNGQTVGAHGNYDGMPGDSSGKEICAVDFSSKWMAGKTKVYRYIG